MRAIAVAFIIACSCLPAGAQRSLYITILPQAGGVFCTLHNYDHRIDEKYRGGSFFGSSFILNGENDNSALIVGAHYARKSGLERLVQERSTGAVTVEEVSSRFNYLDFSINGRTSVMRRPNTRLYLRYGIVYSVGLNGESNWSFTALDRTGNVTYQANYTYDVRFVNDAASHKSISYEEKGDLTLCTGLGVIINRLTIDCGYSGGFLRVFGSDKVPAVNQTIQLSAGFALRKISL